jgi:hypothetical protein
LFSFVIPAKAGIYAVNKLKKPETKLISQIIAGFLGFGRVDKVALNMI